MSEENKNGQGQAYPSNWGPGVTARDYFAAKANPRDVYEGGDIPESVSRAIMGTPAPDCMTKQLENTLWWCEAVAKWKYMQADAMLRAREVKP